MQLGRSGFVALSLLSTTAYPLAPASAATPACDIRTAQSLQPGTITAIKPGTTGNFAVDLEAGEGIIIDLDNVTANADQATSPGYSLALCDAHGIILEPVTSQVFDKDGTTTADGRRLRFAAETSGRYHIAVAPAEAVRELVVRRRDLGTKAPALVRTRLDTTATGTIAAMAPMVFAFAGLAGQWVELKAESEADTVLRLAGPSPEGSYALIAEDDDSDAQNPVIRRRLPVAGTYYVQLASLSGDPDQFRLSLKTIEAPKPAAPPPVLRIGAAFSDQQKGDDDVKLYALNVVAGHSYQLEFAASHDGLLSVGLANPIGAEGDTDPGDESGFVQIDAKDEGTSGIERMAFYARSSAQVLVRIKSFGLDGADGKFTLTVTDLGR